MMAASSGEGSSPTVRATQSDHADGAGDNDVVVVVLVPRRVVASEEEEVGLGVEVEVVVAFSGVLPAWVETALRASVCAERRVEV